MIEVQLAELLPRNLRAAASPTGNYIVVEKELAEPATLADVLGSLGIPRCEVGRITTAEDSRPLDPAGLWKPGSRPVVEGARPRRLAESRFLCDGHLGKLARLLRVMGFDTAWDDGWSEAGMARRGMNEERVVLSRSRSLLKRRIMTRAHLIRSDRPDDQAAEVLRRFLLTDAVRLFGRCSRCNGFLEAVPKVDVAHRIPPRTALWLHDYYICRDCDHLFWEGTHVTALRGRIEGILRAANESRP